MICVVIAKCTFEEALAIAKSADCVELRLDLMQLSAEEIKELVSLPPKFIVTNRPGRDDADTRMKMLRTALAAGASYVDIELEADEDYRREIMNFARMHGVEVIISYHNFDGTPPTGELKSLVDRCFAAGADVAKIACAVRSSRENSRLLGLLDTDQSLIVTGMGEAGRVTRVVAPFLGSLLTYASSGAGKGSASGQIIKEDLEKLTRYISEYVL